MNLSSGFPRLVILLAGACAPADQTSLEPGSGFIPVGAGRVWYEVAGEGPGTPVLLIHGGPGGRSCRLARLKGLGADRPVILYDQLGTGRSDRPTDTTLWRLPRFVEEIDSIRAHLGLTRLHLYGHSWGATVALEYALTRPGSGIQSVTLSGPLVSTPRWIADGDTLRQQMPADLQRTLREHEAAGTVDSPAYRAATDSFYARFMSRRQPPAPAIECEGVTGNDSVYRYMWGPTEFHATGTLRDHDRTDRLGELTLPVLFLAGEFDEARPPTVRGFAEKVPGARFEVITGAGHAFPNDEPEQTIRIVGAFLRQTDSAAPASSEKRD
ncbi:MAG TPA: proline iminopeptidase-family hydrolase [Gemmatimonadales bacterium]